MSSSFYSVRYGSSKLVTHSGESVPAEVVLAQAELVVALFPEELKLVTQLKYKAYWWGKSPDEFTIKFMLNRGDSTIGMIREVAPQIEQKLSRKLHVPIAALRESRDLSSITYS